MTVERHSIYFVPPRSAAGLSPRLGAGGGRRPASISEDSTVSSVSAGSAESVDDEGHGASPEAECSYSTVKHTSLRVRIPPTSSTASPANVTQRQQHSQSQPQPSGSRKSHFVSWKITAPSVKTLGSSTYLLSTEFPSPKSSLQPLLAQATLAASAASNVQYSSGSSSSNYAHALANVTPPESPSSRMLRRSSSSSCQTTSRYASTITSAPSSTAGSTGGGSIRSSSPTRSRYSSTSESHEREHESVLVALAAKPRQAASSQGGEQTQLQQRERSQAVPLLMDSPSLQDSPTDGGMFVVTKANSVLLKARDLNWYLDKVLWKLGVHRKARKDFLTYWLPRFTQEVFVAVRFLPFEDFHSAVPFDISLLEGEEDSSTSPLSSLPIHRVFALFRRVRSDEAKNWKYVVRGYSSTQGVIDWSENCAMPEGWAKDDEVPLLLEVGGLDTGSRSYFFD